jgi:hypothetical protein
MKISLPPPIWSWGGPKPGLFEYLTLKLTKTRLQTTFLCISDGESNFTHH